MYNIIDKALVLVNIYTDLGCAHKTVQTSL